MKKICITLIFVILMTISFLNISYATNTTVSASNVTVNSGEEITVTLTSTVSLSGYTVSVENMDNCAFKSVSVPSGVNVSTNGSKIGAMSNNGTNTLATYKFTAPSVTEKKSYSIRFSITGIESLNDGELSNTTATANITVNPLANNNGKTNNSTGTTTQAKSTEARLQTLGIRPKEYDFSGFSKDRNKEKWSVEVPNSVAEVEIYATAMDKNAKVTGTGKKSLKEGEDNKAEIKVTAEAGNTKTYTLTIKRRTAEEESSQTQENSDASLKKLGITPEKYDFSGFKKDKTQYSVQVPEDVEEIEVYAEATSEKAKVTGTGKTQLKSGKNTLIVQVTAEDGTTQTYTIEAIRGEENATGTDNSVSKFGLSTLEVKGLTLSPNFKTDVYEYKLELNDDLSELDIETIATDDDTTVEILGNENLQMGENTITILVRNQKTEDTATYQIIVNKSFVTAEIVEETSWLRPSTWGKEEIIKVAIFAFLIILIVIAIILKIRISKEKECEEDLEFPGGEELDKALAEHQELSETAEFLMNYEPEDTNKDKFDQGNDLEMTNEKEFQRRSFDDYDSSNYIEDIARSKNYKIDYLERKVKNSGSRRKGKHF